MRKNIIIEFEASDFFKNLKSLYMDFSRLESNTNNIDLLRERISD